MKRAAKAEIHEFDAVRVRSLPGQPRKRFRGMVELAESIDEIGQAQPGIVTLVEDDKRFDAQLVDGERRLRACRQLGVPFLALIPESGDAEEIFAASFGSNFGKQDHDVIEIAEALARLQAAGKSVEQIKRIAGKSDCWVYQHLNILKLHPDVREMMILADGDAEDSDSDAPPRLTFQVAQLLVPLPEGIQRSSAKKIVKLGMSMAAARRMILRARADRGEPYAQIASNKGRHNSIDSIESIIESCSERMGVFLDMPGPELSAILAQADARTKRLLVEHLDALAENLSGLSEAIEQSLPKPIRRPA